MGDRIVVGLPDGRWLAMDQEAFELAVRAGSDLVGAPATDQPLADTRLLTSEQIAEQLSVPATWVEEAARRGDIPSIRAGRYVRFSFADVLHTLKHGLPSSRSGSRL